MIASAATLLRTLSVSPPVFDMTEALLTDQDADAIIGMAESKLSSSVVEDPNSGSMVHGSRTSTVAWLTPMDGPVVRRIFALGSRLLHASLNQFERLQVVRYLPGQYYHQHMDVFEYWKYPPNSDLRR